MSFNQIMDPREENIGSEISYDSEEELPAEFKYNPLEDQAWNIFEDLLPNPEFQDFTGFAPALQNMVDMAHGYPVPDIRIDPAFTNSFNMTQTAGRGEINGFKKGAVNMLIQFPVTPEEARIYGIDPANFDLSYIPLGICPFSDNYMHAVVEPLLAQGLLGMLQRNVRLGVDGSWYTRFKDDYDAGGRFKLTKMQSDAIGTIRRLCASCVHDIVEGNRSEQERLDACVIGFRIIEAITFIVGRLFGLDRQRIIKQETKKVKAVRKGSKKHFRKDLEIETLKMRLAKCEKALKGKEKDCEQCRAGQVRGTGTV